METNGERSGKRGSGAGELAVHPRRASGRAGDGINCGLFHQTAGRKGEEGASSSRNSDFDSFAANWLQSLGIPLTTLDECQEIAVTVDGADEVDPQLRLIKGGGGAMLREKIVASATKQLVIVADASKQVPVLGEVSTSGGSRPICAGVGREADRKLGADVHLRQGPDGKPYLTDENNHILDCRFGQIPDPDGLARTLSEMPGVIEHGLFIGMASVVLFARGSEIVQLRR